MKRKMFQPNGFLEVSVYTAFSGFSTKILNKTTAVATRLLLIFCASFKNNELIFILRETVNPLTESITLKQNQ